MNKRLLQKIRKEPKNQKDITYIKDEGFVDLNIFESAILKFFNENPHFGEIKKDGKSTKYYGQSWYYRIDTSGELKKPIRIRLSDHDCSERKKLNHLSVIIFDESGNRRCPKKTVAYIEKRLERIILKQAS